MKTICITAAAIVSLCMAAESRADLATGIPTQTAHASSPAQGTPASLDNYGISGKITPTQPGITGGISIRPVMPLLETTTIAVPVVHPESSYFFLDAGEGNGAMISMSTTYTPQSISLQSVTVASLPSAPVPLPPAFFLMGSGLLGMAGIRRRTLKNQLQNL